MKPSESNSDIQALIDSAWTLAKDESLDELIIFGQVLLNEVQQRSSQLDSKLTTMLGLAGGMLAFLLVGNELWSKTEAWLKFFQSLLAFATVLGLFSIVFCYLGLRLRQWDFPSRNDWVKGELVADPDKLKRYHLISMLETHAAHSNINVSKADSARVAERLLVSAALTVGITLLLRLAEQLFTKAP